MIRNNSAIILSSIDYSDNLKICQCPNYIKSLWPVMGDLVEDINGSGRSSSQDNIRFNYWQNYIIKTTNEPAKNNRTSDIKINDKALNVSTEQIKCCKIHKRVHFDSILFVEHFYKTTDIPLTCSTQNMKRRLIVATNSGRKLKPCFPLPMSNFLQFQHNLNTKKVCLCEISTIGDDVAGSVTVCNLAYEKTVIVRVTYNNWKNYQDVNCEYRPSLESKKYDKFDFNLALPVWAPFIEFAMCARIGGSTYWDNNEDMNYRINTVSTKQKGTSTWMPSFSDKTHY